jgi:hypothetical protein
METGGRGVTWRTHIGKAMARPAAVTSGIDA